MPRTTEPIYSEARVELEFRDGRRDVPQYLANAMDHLETYRYLYADAVKEANKRMGADVVSSALDKHILGHFRDHR